MGVRSIDFDNYDWELDYSPDDLAAVHTTGCGCCSRTLLVNEKNLDEICYNLVKTHDMVDDVMRYLLSQYTMTWPEARKRAITFRDKI